MIKHMPDAPDINKDWFAHSFDALYPIIYAHRTVEAAEPEARAAADWLGVTCNDDILDLCCGAGRHMVHLRPRAGSVTGLDYSADLLALASRSLGPGARLVRADMRAIPFVETFDVVVNFFTSFGYFFTHAENLAVARGLARALRPGGRFFIDYVNGRHVEQHLQPHTVRESAGYMITEDRWLDASPRRVNKRMFVVRDGVEVRRQEESVRLYTPEEFMQLLSEAGLEVERLMGEYGGSPLEDAQPRMIAVGRRP